MSLIVRNDPQMWLVNSTLIRYCIPSCALARVPVPLCASLCTKSELRAFGVVGRLLMQIRLCTKLIIKAIFPRSRTPGCFYHQLPQLHPAKKTETHPQTHAV